jgi:hypothetical protein
LKLYVYLKEGALIWLILGTIMTILSASSGFELSVRYFLAVIVVWGLIVSLPFSILHEVGSRLERRSRNTPPADEKKES